jgi:poly-gamma-glutamate synthesis protein (capsule biosynthesis protein)
MWTSQKKEFIWSLFLFTLIFFSASQLLNLFQAPVPDKIIPQTATAIFSKPKIIKPNIKLAFVGDIMLDRGVKYSVNKNFGGDYAELFVKVKSQLQNYDLLFGNLEGPVSDKGQDGGNLYSFRMDPKVLPVLKEAGFDAFSIDNNHIFNYGREAFEDTKVRLLENDLRLAGSEPFIFDDIKVMILSFNQFANLDLEETKKEISSAQLTSDLVITYFHFGDEYEPEPNDYQKRVSETAIDAGADLVVGAHPHVVQTLEQYKNVYIMYSLGNFIFDQYFSAETMQGGLLEVEINPETKLIEKVSLKKVQLNKKYQIESII